MLEPFFVKLQPGIAYKKAKAKIARSKLSKKKKKKKKEKNRKKTLTQRLFHKYFPVNYEHDFEHFCLWIDVKEIVCFLDLVVSSSLTSVLRYTKLISVGRAW